MKNLFLIPILLISFASCQKSEPIREALVASLSTSYPEKPQPAKVFDTIPDRTYCVLKFYDVTDSIHNIDGTTIIFNHTDTSIYVKNHDTPYFSGSGFCAMQSISSDGWALAINSLNYHPGVSIPLAIQTRFDGKVLITVKFLRTLVGNSNQTLSQNITVTFVDNYLHRTFNLRTGNYHFEVTRSKLSSWGNNRFVIIFNHK